MRELSSCAFPYNAIPGKPASLVWYMNPAGAVEMETSVDEVLRTAEHASSVCGGASLVIEE